MAEAKAMQAAVQTPSAQFFLTHNHTCSPLIRQARAMVAQR
jgi:predicted dehydrogenase